MTAANSRGCNRLPPMDSSRDPLVRVWGSHGDARVVHRSFGVAAALFLSERVVSAAMTEASVATNMTKKAVGAWK